MTDGTSLYYVYMLYMYMHEFHMYIYMYTYIYEVKDMLNQMVMVKKIQRVKKGIR